MDQKYCAVIIMMIQVLPLLKADAKVGIIAEANI